MKVNNTSGVTKKWFTLQGIILTLLTTPAEAGGNKTFGVSARAQSMGNAFVAVADDAAAVFYNPAGLLQIKETGMIMDLLPVFPHATYTNSLNDDSITNKLPGAGLSSFFSKRMGEEVAVGMGIYAPLARGTRYKATPALYGEKVKTFFVDLHVAGVIAFKAFDRLSLGMGPILNFDVVNIRALGIKQSYAMGTGASGVFSALYTVSDWTRLGVTYHLPSSMNLGGHGSGWPGGNYFNEKFRLKYNNPGFVDFGVSFRATPTFLVSLAAGIEFWNKAKDARYFYRDPIYDNHLVFGYNNTQNYSVGIEYHYKTGRTLRLGYSYHPIALPPEGILPGALDFSANVFSVGYGYVWNAKWTLNVGYEYATSPAVINPAPILNPFVGRYKASANTVLLGLTYQI